MFQAIGSLENSIKTTTALLLLFIACINCIAQTPGSDRQQFIRVEAPIVALVHVRVIDGKGAAPLEDQTIVIAVGNIESMAPSGAARAVSDGSGARSSCLSTPASLR